MKPRLTLLCFFCSAAIAARAEVTPPAVSAVGVTLQECYARSLRVSEDLAVSEENIRFVEQQYREKVGAILPHIDWIKTQFYQDSPSAASGTGATGTSLLTTQPQSYFQLTQPIFSGFRDFMAVAALKSLRAESKWRRDQAALSLLGDVAQVFYTTLTLQQDYELMQNTHRLTEDRIKDLRHRVEIGRSRKSEVLSAEAQLAALEAQMTETRRAHAAARATLEFLTGIPSNMPLLDDQPLPTTPAIEETPAVFQRPDVLAAEEALHQTGYGIKYAKGGHLPTLGLTARSYTERVGFLDSVRWDALLTLDMPLFEGFTTSAQVQEARSQEIEAQLALRRVQRNAARQIRTAQQDVSHLVAETRAYEKAVALAERNYRAQLADYRLGLISNLDVLKVLNDLETVKQQRLNAVATTKLSAVQLKIALGQGL